MNLWLVVLLVANTMMNVVLIYFILNIIKKTENFSIENNIKWGEWLEEHKKLEHKLEYNYLLYKLKKVCFIGIGGGGCNTIENISKFDNRHKFIHINSDIQALKTKTSKYKILLGFEKKAGLGCGGKEKCGKDLIDEYQKSILSGLIEDDKIVYIVSTLGGGIGSGATPEIVSYLNNLAKEVIVFAIMPFSFEGKIRRTIAANAIDKIKSTTDNVIVIENDDFIDKKSIGFVETFKTVSSTIYKRIVDAI